MFHVLLPCVSSLICTKYKVNYVVTSIRPRYSTSAAVSCSTIRNLALIVKQIYHYIYSHLPHGAYLFSYLSIMFSELPVCGVVFHMSCQ